MLTDVLIPPARTGRNEAAGDGGDGVEPKPTPGQTHNRHLPAPHRPMRSLPTVIRSGSSGHQPGVSAIAGPWPLTPVEPGVTCRPGVPWRTAMGNAPGVRCHGTGLRTDRFTMRLRALRSVRTAQPRMGSADGALDRVGGTTSRRLMPSRFMTQSGSSGKLVIWAWSRDGIVGRVDSLQSAGIEGRPTTPQPECRLFDVAALLGGLIVLMRTTRRDSAWPCESGW
jgi:hypothetical protein